jgi:type I restriction enzyme S subunit
MANSYELVGKVSYVEHIATKSTFGGFIAAIRTNSLVNPKYLFYYFRSSETQAILRSNSSQTVNIANLSLRSLYPTPVPLAPLAEQERIVAEIEKQFTRLDTAVSALRRVRGNLARYKAAVLKAACEGRLVAQDPNDEPASELLARISAERRRQWEQSGKKGKYQEPVGVDVDAAELPELPVGWVWTTLDAVASIVSGVAKGRKFGDRKTLHLPYLRVANVQQGYLDLTVIKEIEVLPGELEAYRLEKDDLLLTEGGDWDKLGRSAIWRGQIKNCIHQNHIFRARPYLSLIPTEWLMFVTNSEFGRKYFAGSSKQTTNLASINLTQLRTCPVPLPPVDEIHRIISEVERRLSVVQAVEQVTEANLIRAERLRQAILQRAFSGQLVAQDPNDEPAGVVVEEIQLRRGNDGEEEPEKNADQSPVQLKLL